MPASNQKYIIKRLGSHFVVWFRATKSFAVFTASAFDVFILYTTGTHMHAIIDLYKEQYKHIGDDIPRFVEEVIRQIRFYSNAANAEVYSKKALLKHYNACNSFLPPVHYHIGSKLIQVKHGNDHLKSLLHPVLQHLETSSIKKVNHSVECYTLNSFLVYSCKGKVVDAFENDNTEYLTGGVKQLIYSLLYNKSYNSWLAIFHASGVVQNSQAILFSAAGGSGKSTLSALLKAHGYGYLSDDLIAADIHGNVYPFPAAISVKEGSTERLSEYYPGLRETNSQLLPNGKKVRYIPVHNQEEISNAPYPVKAMVFVNYSQSGPFEFEEVDKKEALRLLLKETWVNPTIAKVNLFFVLVDKTPFYRLQYGHTGDALRAVNKLFAL